MPGPVGELPETRAMRADAVQTTHLRGVESGRCVICREVWPCELVMAVALERLAGGVLR